MAIESRHGMCQGTLIDSDEAGGVVLTAAHCLGAVSCVQADCDTTLSVTWSSAVGVQRTGVARTQKHPFFSRRPGSPYDFGLLEVPGLRGASVQALPVSFDALDTGFQRAVWSARKRRLLAVQVVHDRELTFSFRSGAEVCRGESGAPIVKSGVPPLVVGVVSHGDRDCRDEATAGKTSAMSERFLAAFQRRRPLTVGELSESCAACAERLEASDACVGAMGRCEGDADCRRLLECWRACGSRSCVEACGGSSRSGR